MRGGPRKNAGRKPVKIDLLELEKLAALNCTDNEVAGWFGVSTRTVELRRKQAKFAEAMSRGRARGRISIRRQQLKILESGNSAMAIWLGKQLLNQRDPSPTERNGPDGDPAQVSLEVLDAILARTKKTRKS
jgi:hypothetical protein